MKKEESAPLRFQSLSQAHQALGLPKPLHPLISLLNGAHMPPAFHPPSQPHVLAFYKISYKPLLGGKLKYGQGYYDFDEGGLLFAAPGQIVGGAGDTTEADCSLYTLLIHPDFFRNYPLARTIKGYGFFSYSVNEALHLSESEKETIFSIFGIIEAELAGRIDEFSQDIVVAQIALLLSYANRFYKRQFLTRKAVSHTLLEKLEAILNPYFEENDSLMRGLPTVQFLAERLNLSPSYLSDMLRALTGQNTQQLIHAKVIEKAKDLLSATDLTVSEVAYQLGFEHPQSFSKLFKAKTNTSPVQFRQGFN